MPSGSILLKADIQRTPRVAQVEGLFDLPETHSATCSIEYDIQTPEQWSIHEPRKDICRMVEQ